MNSHAPFWIEVLDKSGAVALRQRVDAGVVTLGRGYANDIVIDDAFVAPTHLRIGYDSEVADDTAGVGGTTGSGSAAGTAAGSAVETLWLEDLGTKNGTFDVIRQANVHRLLIGDEASVRIGHTGLRIRRASFEVSPTLPLDAPGPAAYASLLALGYGNAAIFMMAAFVAAATLSTWLSQTSEFKLAAYLPSGVILPLVVLGWAGIWTLLTRLVTARGEFFHHVAIAFAFMVALFVVDLAVDFAIYAFAWIALQRWMAIFLWVMFGILCFAHIRAITVKHRRPVAAIVGALVVVGIGVHISLRAESERVQPQRISAHLMPPFLLMKSPVAPDAFFKDTFALKPKLDEERTKEPSSGGFSFADFD